MADKASDSERLGVFKDSSYISIGDPYKSGAAEKPVNFKGKQFTVSSSKSKKTGALDGFFDQSYGRMFEGEAVYDAVKQMRQAQKESKGKNVGGAFVPSSGSKSTGGRGNVYGTFAGKIEHFEAVTIPPKPREPQKRNFYTNPAKKGTGYGYLNVTLGGNIKYAPEPYDGAHELELKEHEAHKTKLRAGAFKTHTAGAEVFDTNPYKDEKGARAPPPEPKKKDDKKIVPFYPTKPGLSSERGQNFIGTFDKYPSHSEEPPRERVPHVAEKVFRPPFHSRTRPVKSIMAANVARTVNARNFRSVPVS